MNEFQNMPEEMKAYKAAEFRMPSDEAFAGSIRKIARKRKRNRERARSSVLSLTSIMLFMTIFYGVPDFQKNNQENIWGSEYSQSSDELMTSIDSSIDDLWSTTATQSESEELLTAIDYDLSDDVISELAGYDDEIVLRALKQLESTEIF